MLEKRLSDIGHLKWLAEENLSSLKGLKVLDLGCGSGFICAEAKAKGATVSVGIDIIEPENSKQERQWTFIQGDLEKDDWCQDFQSKGQDFDVILAFDVVEHLSSPFQFLCSCQKLLSKNGKLVITTPNTMSLERVLRPTGWSGATDPQHKVLFNKYSLGFLLEKCGLKVRNLRAPMRSLSFLKGLAPHIGGQLIAVAQRAD